VGFVLPWLLSFTIAAVLFSGLLLAKTRFGRYIYAYGASKDAVVRAGVNTKRHTTWLYGLAGLAAGLAGYLSTAHFETASPVAGSQYLLIAVAAAVIGGTTLQGGEGTIWGTVIGALIISVLENGFVIVGMASFWQLVAVGVMVIVAVYFNEIQRRSRLAAVGRRQRQ
jgi:ribose transport system permease protein